MPFPPDTLLMRMRLEGGLCPDCFGRQFWRGPQGGVAVNVQCDGCGAAFNVCVYGGQLIHCDRIGGDGFMRYADTPAPLAEAARPYRMSS
jgi:hypothetical protein